MVKTISTTTKHRNRGIKSVPAQISLVAFLVFILICTLLPLGVTFIMSFKASEDIMAYPIWTLPKAGWMFSNYKNAFDAVSLPMVNTVIIGLVSTFIVLLMSCFVAMMFQRYKFAGKNALFFLFIAPMLVPGVVLLSPTYIVVAQWLNLEGNWLGLILPYIAGNQIASVFLFRVFMGQQPDSLYESCSLDGANMFQQFLYLALPLTIPIILIQGLAIFAAMYNDYLWPLLLFQRDLSKGVLMPYLRAHVRNFEQGVQYAMYLVAGIPLVITTSFSIAFFIDGDFASGIKL